MGGAAKLKRFWPNTSTGFNAARGFVGGAALAMGTIAFTLLQFQCRTRLCGWCSVVLSVNSRTRITVSMPHAALWVVQHGEVIRESRKVSFQCRTRLCGWCSRDAPRYRARLGSGFNAARGFVGGAALTTDSCRCWLKRFQCRTRLCGWCSYQQQSC